MIKIDNLTGRQVQIMDLLWTCRDDDQLRTLIQALPTARDQQDALSLVQVATWECLEQQAQLDQYETAAKDIIRRCSSPS